MNFLNFCINLGVVQEEICQFLVDHVSRQTIRRLREQPLTLASIKQGLPKLLEQLASIRHDIAVKTETLDSKLFGHSRNRLLVQ